MRSLLVISNEPALAETLASELEGITVTGVRANDAESHVHKEDYSLVIIDSDTHYKTDLTDKAITFTRPIRLSEAIYTILQRLKGKTASPKEETLLENCIFIPGERLLRSKDGSATVTLTEKEAELLQHFLAHSEKVLSRDALLKDIWGYSGEINTHTLETHIYRLRNKLKQANPLLDIIFLEEGGYQLQREG